MSKKAAEALLQDKKLSRIVKRYGAVRVPRGKPGFMSLVRIIVNQQLSGAAAGTILSRLYDRLGKVGMNPAAALDLPDSEFRGAGVSGGKTRYIKGVAQLLVDRPGFLEEVVAMSDGDAIDALVQIKGIGVWSAGIFLLFDCGRRDIFPVGDAALNRAVKLLYGVDGDAAEAFASRWSPYRSYACLYLWKWLDDPDCS